jgi:hypothetical protein
MVPRRAPVSGSTPESDVDSKVIVIHKHRFVHDRFLPVASFPPDG